MQHLTCCLSVSGTSHDGGYSHEAVVYALRECGVRHIDTAKRYDCEEHLAKAVQESGVPRRDVWLTTKLWPGDYGYRTTKQACKASCARLGVEYLGTNDIFNRLWYHHHHLLQWYEHIDTSPCLLRPVPDALARLHGSWSLQSGDASRNVAGSGGALWWRCRAKSIFFPKFSNIS